MTEYNRLVRYWSSHPPVHLLVRALFDFKEEGDTRHELTSVASEKPWETESFEDLVKRWNAAGGGYGGN
jgi:hypothetical protein